MCTHPPPTPTLLHPQRAANGGGQVGFTGWVRPPVNYPLVLSSHYERRNFVLKWFLPLKRRQISVMKTAPLCISSHMTSARGNSVQGCNQVMTYFSRTKGSGHRQIVWSVISLNKNWLPCTIKHLSEQDWRLTHFKYLFSLFLNSQKTLFNLNCIGKCCSMCLFSFCCFRIMLLFCTWLLFWG